MQVFGGVLGKGARRTGLLAGFALLLLATLLFGGGSARAASGPGLGNVVSTVTAPVTKAVGAGHSDGR